jgi:predicted dehydrogenase/threonine dehydrogenase-like Zn-dependent dehydrogenase
MKQVVQEIRSGNTRVEDVPAPAVLPGTALVMNSVSLVSAGTERSLVEFAGRSMLGKARSRPDLVRQVLSKAAREGVLSTFDAVQNRLDQPMALGYSSAGTILALGDGMEGFHVGQRVACAGGGFAVHAEFVVVPRNLLAPLPDEVDFESGAFGTLGAIALHGFRLGKAALGEYVAIIGLGLLGLLAAQIAHAAGCRVLGIDLDAGRVARAQAMGVDAVERQAATEVGRAFSRGRGFDLVQICADTPSNDTVELAGEIARNRGRVVSTGVVGTQLPRKAYYEKELNFIISRSYGPGRYDPAYEEAGIDYPAAYVRWTEGRNLEGFLQLVANGSIEVLPLVTHRFSIEQAVEAYQVIRGDTGEPFLAVLLQYPHPSTGAEPRTRIELHQAPAPEPSVHLGVVGAGNFATAVMLPAQRSAPDVSRVSLVSARGLNAQAVGRKFGFQRAETDFDSLLHASDINTLAILTRHHLHADQTTAGLKAGKHVFCEKPLALNREELERILQALRESKNLLTVGYNRRFAPLAIRLKTFLEPVSDPLMITYRVNAGPLPLTHWLHDPQQGGGRLVGEGCHFIDFMTYLCGQPPVRATASALPDHGSYHEDNFGLTLDFADGSVGQLVYVANGDRALPKERIEVFGGGRAAILDDFRRLERIADGRRRSQRSWLRQDKGHAAEWQAFIGAIRTGGPPPIPYEHLFGVASATFAGLESIRTKKPVDVEHFTFA